ncbi:MAG: outer membrane beta-barrel protein, partial [Campylobacterota bacterium]
YADVDGAGIQGSARFALSDRFALTPSLGMFHLSGDHSYVDDTVGKVNQDMDYDFVTGGLRAEVQHRIERVNFIAFAGATFHYGKSDDTVTYADSDDRDVTESTDEGLGWEAGVQAAIQTGPFMTTLFYKYDYMRVDTENEDAQDNSVQTDEEQEFTFKSSTLGIDLLFNNGISLSGLYTMPDQSQSEDITMIKLGFSF